MHKYRVEDIYIYIYIYIFIFICIGLYLESYIYIFIYRGQQGNISVLVYPEDVCARILCCATGIYAIMGTPMVMSFDIRDDSRLLPLWDILTNEEILGVNQVRVWCCVVLCVHVHGAVWCCVVHVCAALCCCDPTYTHIPTPTPTPAHHRCRTPPLLLAPSSPSSRPTTLVIRNICGLSRAIRRSRFRQAGPMMRPQSASRGKHLQRRE
jgi:hypothetical protein